MSTQVVKTDINFMNEVFSKIMGASPAFKQSFTDTKILIDAKRIWLRVFIDNNLNDWRKIEQGIIALASDKNPFVPTAGQFVSLCNPSAESLGLPPLQKAYEQACKNASPTLTTKEWLHDVVKFASKEAGSWNLLNLPTAKSFPLFKYNYEIIINKFMDGELLKDVPKAITKKNHIIVDGIEFELIGRNAVSNIVNYQVAGGTLKFSEFDKLFTETLKLKG